MFHFFPLPNESHSRKRWLQKKSQPLCHNLLIKYWHIAIVFKVIFIIQECLKNDFMLGINGSCVLLHQKLTTHNFCCYFLMLAMIDDKCSCTLIGFHLTPPSFPSKWLKRFMASPFSIEGIANITPNSSKQTHPLVCSSIGLEYRF